MHPGSVSNGKSFKSQYYFLLFLPSKWENSNCTKSKVSLNLAVQSHTSPYLIVDWRVFFNKVKLWDPYLVHSTVSDPLTYVQWLPLENQRVLFYEAKVPFSERWIAVWKCHHAIELLRHSYHTSALSKEVYDFVFAQGAQKLWATIRM